MEEDDLISLLFSNPTGAISDISCHGEAAISSSSQYLPSAWSQSSYMDEISPLNANANTNILLAQAQGDDGFAMPAEDVEVKRSVLGKRSLPEEFRDNDAYSASLMNLQPMTAGAPSPQNNVVQGNLMNLQNNSGMTTQSQSTGTLGNGHVRPRVRARRGQATDPHSIAERLRRERIADGMKSLQELVPNANKTDKVSMLDEIIDYVRFLQMQVKVMSMSRLGGGGAIPSQGSGSQVSTALSQEGLAFEQTVASLLESDMTTAMQLLQNKGLCLIPMALVTAMSSSTKKTVSRSSKTVSIHDTSSSEKHTLGLSESTGSAIAGIGAHRFNSGSSPEGSSKRCFQ